ncbi:MAG: ATP-binding protein [Dyadobacter sp.]|uniref:ATP-binding protein n=1 Tax=Dyadobacter sp. TaxID=1914288 RepID=UPI003264CEA1
MTYSQLFFRKRINELTYDDIKDFFRVAQEESDKLEFKSFGSDLNSRQPENPGQRVGRIVRTVCAMLNSMGGLIVWGAPIGKNSSSQKGKGLQRFIGTGYRTDREG